MTETKTEKVDRLISEGKVARQLDLPDGGSVWRVNGDSERTRRVVVNQDGSEWSCDCPYMFPDCSHAWAVLRILGMEPPIIDEDDPAPTGTLDVDLPVEVIDTGPAGETEPGEPAPIPAVVPDPDPDLSVPELPRDLIPIDEAPTTWRTIQTIQNTEIVPREMRGKPSTILAAMLQGRDWGLGPFESLRMVNVIEGRIAPSAEMLLRFYYRAGHRMTVDQMDDRVVTVTGTRSDNGDTRTISFTLADAERAGLITITEDGEVRARSQNNRALPWETYTPDLLWARAVTRLVSRLAPDCADQRIPT